MSSNSSASTLPGLRGWVCIRTAAEFLGKSPDALRRSIERHVVRGPDGALEANIDGVRARKFAGRWRVKLSAAWLADTGSDDKNHGAPCATSSPRPRHAVRPERS
ncbi:hypothetical protein [Sorangium sp. So ce1000]|uniref:hypothetical protein n=1 Tax=Sorangium sp. So ce1000 TaxID=3133325 RepID=UPI003F62AFA2